MRFTLVSTALCGATAVTALSIPTFFDKRAQTLPLSSFSGFKTITLEQAKNPATFNNNGLPGPKKDDTLVSVAATCTNPNVRFEWRSYSTSDRKAFVDGIACLMSKPPSGNFSPAKSRYEDLVRVHQLYTANIHGNHKFLLWHRYFTWTFEQIMRSECGFNRAFPWWDETLDAGKFAQSSIFTDDYFGRLAAATNGKGTCVTTGVSLGKQYQGPEIDELIVLQRFAGTTLHIGPGTRNIDHCLARAVDESFTAQVNSGFVSQCNSYSNYSDMAKCSELGPHAYGHNGVGAVMSDVSASPGDPTFFLHHLFIDRNFRIWQNALASRKTTINGCADSKSPCTPLTLDTWVYMGGLRPNLQVRDILDTMNGVMCYRYSY